MKNLPYTSCFVVVQINNSIRKMFFDEVVDYENYSDPDFTDHQACMAQMAFAHGQCADELFMLLCQAYLNANSVIKEFNSISVESCSKSTDMCVSLIVDINETYDGGATIEIVTLANDEKSDAFNYIAEHLSEKTVDKFVDSLTVEQQDLLFDFA